MATATKGKKVVRKRRERKNIEKGVRRVAEAERIQYRCFR